jgi:hypothetical protein
MWPLWSLTVRKHCAPLERAVMAFIGVSINIRLLWSQACRLNKYHSRDNANAHDKLKCVGHKTLRNQWCLPTTVSARKEVFLRVGSSQLQLAYQFEG